MFSLFPISWNGVNSGVSRKCPLRTALRAMKFPSLAVPQPKVAFSL